MGDVTVTPLGVLLPHKRAAMANNAAPDPSERAPYSHVRRHRAVHPANGAGSRPQPAIAAAIW